MNLNRLSGIALVTFLIILFLTAASYYLFDTDANRGLAIVMMVPLLPGFLGYVIMTGDVHFGYMTTGLTVVPIVSWVFWTAIVYAIVTKRKKREADNQQ